MADQLYLSYWLRDFTPLSMLHQYSKVLGAFPYSKLEQSQSSLRIWAVSFREPALIEETFLMPDEGEAVVEACTAFQNADCCYELSTAWDLWHRENEWKLGPAGVELICYGPEFEGEHGENLRISFGLEQQFLPLAESPGSMPMVQANIKSLLRLVSDLDKLLPVEKRLLWPESGGNFAERVQDLLE